MYSFAFGQVADKKELSGRSTVVFEVCKSWLVSLLQIQNLEKLGSSSSWALGFVHKCSSCMLGSFSRILLSSADFFTIMILKKIFQEYHLSVKKFGSII